jgi:hypothetical protein
LYSFDPEPFSGLDVGKRAISNHEHLGITDSKMPTNVLPTTFIGFGIPHLIRQNFVVKQAKARFNACMFITEFVAIGEEAQFEPALS